MGRGGGVGGPPVAPLSTALCKVQNMFKAENKDTRTT